MAEPPGHVDRPSSSGVDLPAEPVTSAEIMNTVLDAASSDADINALALDQLAAPVFSSLLESLVDAMFEKGQALSKEEQEAFERGDPEKIRAALKRVRKALTRRRAIHEANEKVRTDGLVKGQPHPREPRSLTAPDHLPADTEPSAEAAEPKTPRTDPSSQDRPAGTQASPRSAPTERSPIPTTRVPDVTEPSEPPEIESPDGTEDSDGSPPRPFRRPRRLTRRTRRRSSHRTGDSRRGQRRPEPGAKKLDVRGYDALKFSSPVQDPTNLKTTKTNLIQLTAKKTAPSPQKAARQDASRPTLSTGTPKTERPESARPASPPVASPTRSNLDSPKKPMTENRGAMDDASSSKPASPGSKKLASQLRSLGLGRPAASFDQGDLIPPEGFSKNAHAVPVLQFMPRGWLKTLRGLGIRNLVDFLIHASTPEPRTLLARALGAPTLSLMLMSYRAEMLDLPVTGLKAKNPHLKDVLLLSRLGVRSVRQLALLAEAFRKQPLRLEVLASLLSAYQKAVPASVGKERINRFDLAGWAQAALKRPSSVSVEAPAFSAQTPAEAAGEQILGWYLEQSSQAWQDPEMAWDDLMTRVMILLRQQKIRLDQKILNQMEHAWDQERIQRYRTLLEQEEVGAELAALEQELKRYRDYVLQIEDADEASVAMDLFPWFRPDTERKDRMICFWMDPTPDQPRITATNESLPTRLLPIYVCIDPDSGAIIPQT